MTAVGGFDPQDLLRTLGRHQVRFVLIGGWAAVLHGSPTVTVDLDICYDRTPTNLERLASALAELEVRLRGFPPDLPFAIDARALRSGDVFTLTTRAGDLDLLGDPVRAREMGQQGRAKVAATYDSSRLVRDIETLYEDLVRQKSGPA